MFCSLKGTKLSLLVRVVTLSCSQRCVLRTWLTQCVPSRVFHSAVAECRQCCGLHLTCAGSTMEYHTSEGVAAGGTVAPGLWRSKGWGESESGDSCQEVFCCGSVTTVPKRDTLCSDSQLWVTQSSRLFSPHSPLRLILLEHRPGLTCPSQDE